MRLKTTILAGLAVALVLAMGISPAWAYFTDSSTANGGLRIGVTPSTDITEEYGERTKQVTITNAADATTAVFVRARVYSSLPVQVSGTSWTGPDADGWYTFANPVEPGAATEVLSAAIQFPETRSDTNPEGAQEGDNYNVVVVYESTPVQYDESGQAYADWTFVLDSGN